MCEKIGLNSHYTLGFHLVVITNVFKKHDVRSRPMVVCALRLQEVGGCVWRVHDTHIQTQ